MFFLCGLKAMIVSFHSKAGAKYKLNNIHEFCLRLRHVAVLLFLSSLWKPRTEVLQLTRESSESTTATQKAVAEVAEASVLSLFGSHRKCGRPELF